LPVHRAAAFESDIVQIFAGDKRGFGRRVELRTV
jgi:hypothetical protein